MKLNCEQLQQSLIDPPKSSEAGMALRKYPELRQANQNFVPPKMTNQWLQAVPGKVCNLGQGSSFLPRAISREEFS